jgi:predicted transcriptional regulator
VFKLFVHTYKNVELYSSSTIHLSVVKRGKNMSVRLRKRERDRIGIVAEILEMARGGVLKSSIMWRARLSYIMLNGYLGLMMNTKLLDKVLMNKKVVFKTTDRGLKFLHHCYEIMELLETEDDGNKLYRRVQLLPTSLSS